MARNILITGANGTISTQTIPTLRQGGANIRAVIRDPAKAAPLTAQGCEVVIHDLDQPVRSNLFKGIDAALFLTAPNPNASKQMSNLIEAAKGSHVHVIRMSALKAAADAPTDNGRQHHQSDEELRASGLTHTILRPQFFLQNMLWNLETVQTTGKLPHGMGDGRLSMIDTRDVADCAAKILLEGGHEGKIYTPTGPTTITWNDVAKSLTNTLGMPVEPVPITLDQVRQGFLDMGLGDWVAKVMADYAKAYANGWGDFVTQDVKTITGKEPRSLNTFCKEVVAPMAQAIPKQQ